MHTRLCSPGYSAASKLRIPKVRRTMELGGRYTDLYECGCEFHGRMVDAGRYAGHHYGDGIEYLCDTHAMPDPE